MTTKKLKTEKERQKPVVWFEIATENEPENRSVERLSELHKKAFPKAKCPPQPSVKIDPAPDRQIFNFQKIHDARFILAGGFFGAILSVFLFVSFENRQSEIKTIRIERERFSDLEWERRRSVENLNRAYSEYIDAMEKQLIIQSEIIQLLDEQIKRQEKLKRIKNNGR